MRKSVAPKVIILSATLFVALPLIAQDEVLKSGPQPGTVLPGSFAPLNLNGKVAAGRHHCLVCEYNLDPVLLVFAREPAAGKDAVFNQFLQKIDMAIDRHELYFLKSFVVFLSRDARSSLTDSNIAELQPLVDEATDRRKFIERLKPRLEATKNLRYAVFPVEGPKEYNIDPKAEISVIFFKRHRVMANFAFAADKMTPDDVNNVMRTVDKLIAVEPLEK